VSRRPGQMAGAVPSEAPKSFRRTRLVFLNLLKY
jgi:hypothetical protein